MLPLLAVPALAQAGVGLFQSLFSGKGKAQKELEKLPTPTYNGSRPINQFYNEALSRFNTSPYESAAFKTQQNQIGGNAATGIAALQGRRSALAGIGNIVNASNDATQNSVVAAEQEQGRRFNQLGNATQMKNSDDRFAYDTNVMLPFQKKSQLLAMKAGAAAETQNNGMKNLLGGLSNVSSILGSQSGDTATPTMSTGTPSSFTYSDYQRFKKRGY